MILPETKGLTISQISEVAGYSRPAIRKYFDNLTTPAYGPQQPRQLQFTSTTDANSHTSTATFYFENRPLVVTKANTDAVTYAYDGSGQAGLLSTKTDGNAHVTRFYYTSRNQPSSTTFPDSTTESWTYNNDGSVAAHVDGKAQSIAYGYDHRGLLTSVAYPTGVGISYTFVLQNMQSGFSQNRLALRTNAMEFSRASVSKNRKYRPRCGKKSASEAVPDRRWGACRSR